MAKRLPSTMGCYIGSLGLHTFNAECTECIWCGPNALACKPGRWVPVEDEAGRYLAWSADCEPQLAAGNHD
jgi:hypothetical protein